MHKPDQTDIVRISEQEWIDSGKEPLPSWMKGETQLDQENLEAMWSQVQGKLGRGLSSIQMKQLFGIAQRSKDAEEEIMNKQRWVFGWEHIRDERHRQIQEEGLTPERDDEYVKNELVDAARCYLLASMWPGHQLPAGLRDSSAVWPFDESWWKPSTDPIRNLEKAGALIAAEIDRLTRAQGEYNA